MASILVAGLELARRGQLTLAQDGDFRDINVYAVQSRAAIKAGSNVSDSNKVEAGL